MNSHFRRSGLLLLPVFALGIWGYFVGRPNPPVPPDAPHISAAVAAHVTRQLSGRRWFSPKGEEFVFLKFEVFHARMSSDRKRVFMRTRLSCDEFIPAQILPAQYGEAREVIFHGAKNGVYSGNVEIGNYGIIRVDVTTTKSN